MSELDRRGRAIRRSPPLTIGDIAGIAGTHEDSVIRVVDTFRAPECCFLMPSASEPLTTATPVDISHESLLRRWTRMTGTPPHEGWLTEEDKDGKTYRRLADDADTFADDRSALLPPRQTRTLADWWKKAEPTAAWADRYGGKFPLVEEFLHTSMRRERWQRGAKYAAVVSTIALLLGILITGSFWLAEAQKRQELEEKANDLATERNQSSREVLLLTQQNRQQTAALQAQVQELEEQNQSLRATRRSTPDTSPPVPATPRPEDVVQVAKPDPSPSRPNDAAASANQQGFVWVGSPDKSNLQTLAGDPVAVPNEVRVGEQFVMTLNIYLRAGPPDPTTYSQQPSVAVIAPNTRIEITAPPVPYSRPTGTQYWAGVRVVSVALPTVFFQFAGGSREQAQAVSKALQARGYRIPGEERTPAAAGQRTVRFFYAADRAAAEKLAAETTATLQKLGYANLEVSVSDQTASTKKNPAGLVELWLDLPPR
jgi:hypothetical protein